MAYDESLANRVRAALGNTRHMQERRMFGGLVFMVRRKMCVSVGKKRISGYVYIDAEVARTKRHLDYWVHLALDCNGS